MEGPGGDLWSVIGHAEPLLARVKEERASTIPAPGKWCNNEIIGHLLDSANNNLARFNRLQSTDHLFLDPYAQEDWVKAQAYA